MRKTAPKLKGPQAPKPLKKANQARRRAQQLTWGDVLWFSVLWLPATVAKYAGKAVVLTVAVTAAGAAKGGTFAYRHVRPHLAKGGRWCAAKANTGYRKVEHRAAGRWAKRHNRPAPQPKPAPVEIKPPNRPKPKANQAVPAARPAPAAETPPTPTPRPASWAGAGATTSQIGNSSTATTGGIRMQEFQRMVQAARPIAQMDPKTAWELDEQFAAFAALWPRYAEFFMAYTENLDRNVKIDPRVVNSLTANVAAMNELWKSFSQTRRIYRELYKPYFENNGVRMPDRKGFWDQKAA